MYATSYWSYKFENKIDSIRFAVDRYYKYDLYKTIREIIAWGCYISPIDWRFKCFDGFAHTTTERHENYIFAVRQYYKNNIANYKIIKYLCIFKILKIINKDYDTRTIRR